MGKKDRLITHRSLGATYVTRSGLHVARSNRVGHGAPKLIVDPSVGTGLQSGDKNKDNLITNYGVPLYFDASL